MDSLSWWGLLCGFCLLIELSSPGYFFFLSFSLGALGALLGTYIGGSLVVQTILFFGVTGISFLLLRRYVAKLAKKASFQTNVYALQGKRGVVVEQVSPFEKGWVKVEGELWAAIPSSEATLEKGVIVEVVSSAGTHLSVRHYMHTEHSKQAK